MPWWAVQMWRVMRRWRGEVLDDDVRSAEVAGDEEKGGAAVVMYVELDCLVNPADVAGDEEVAR
eukprot:744187-Rhodomonas_salina.2